METSKTKSEFIPNKAISSLIRFNSEDIMDNAQYLSLLFLDTFKIKLEVNVSLKKPVNKSPLEKVYIEGKGILLGSTSGMFGEVEYYLNGVTRAFKPTGEMILTSKDFQKHIKEESKNGDNVVSSLHYDSKAYIKPVNKWDEEKYYGIFYSLKDAIKIITENDFVKVGEVTS